MHSQPHLISASTGFSLHLSFEFKIISLFLKYKIPSPHISPVLNPSSGDTVPQKFFWTISNYLHPTVQHLIQVFSRTNHDQIFKTQANISNDKSIKNILKSKKGKIRYLSESPPTMSPVRCRKEEKVTFSIWGLRKRERKRDHVPIHDQSGSVYGKTRPQKTTQIKQSGSQTGRKLNMYIQFEQWFCKRRKEHWIIS